MERQLSIEQYLAIAQLAYTEFSDTEKAKTISELLRDNDVLNENTDIFDQLGAAGQYQLFDTESLSSGFYAQVYRPPSNGDALVFSFCGTTPYDNDLLGFFSDLDNWWRCQCGAKDY